MFSSETLEELLILLPFKSVKALPVFVQLTIVDTIAVSLFLTLICCIILYDIEDVVLVFLLQT